MEQRVKYGKTYIGVRVPQNTEYIKIRPPAGKAAKDSFTEELSARLKPGIGSAGIVVSDKTRLCGYDTYLPCITQVLEEKGTGRDAVRFYIAYGTHPRQSESESLDIYGNLYKEYEFVHHDCDDSDAMVNLGITERGTDIMVRKDIFEHDQLILFGSISHHYFAAYGGGRKLLFPGLASRQSIYHNHKLFLDFDNYRLHYGCRSGKLNGNPVAEDLYEIDCLMPEKIIISGITDPSGGVSELLIGDGYMDFINACRIYDSYYRIDCSTGFDNVIASCGGFPKDINFIQAHKSLHNAASFVRDGGNLILLGECRDGIGNETFLDIFGGTKIEVFNNLRKNYSGNGGTALSLLSKTERINIFMLTGLDAGVCDTLNIVKLDENELRLKTGGLKGLTALIENASLVYC
ncbi:MAG: DUF2088 domain-containing protein [Bacteroidales bacterium]|nr:DUF2088 domain-containing protein [Bacteroidales bacterium]